MTTRSLRHARGALLALFACAQLVGCTPLLIGGAVVGGTMVATDRRSAATQLEDQLIESKAGSRVRELLGERGRVTVTSYNRLVLLTGDVATSSDKTAVEQAVARVDTVRTVVNELAVTGSPSLSTSSNDTFLTTQVKASMVGAKGLYPSTIKVVTERGIVYLMGRVTEQEATRASNLARGVTGVNKVVRVFEILTEAELAAIEPGAAPR